VDPTIAPIVAAVAAGAAAGLKQDAAQAVRDAYGVLKAYLKKQYSRIDLGPVEQRPASKAKRDSLEEDLSETGAASDPELRRLAETLVAAIDEHDPDSAGRVEIDLKDLRAKFLTIERVTAHETRVHVEGATVEGGATISDIHGGGGPDPNS
jgi:hypothetical protein